MSLHCVYNSAHGTTADLPRQLADGDCVLLLADACVLALPDSAWLDALDDRQVYTLDEDLAARGIQETDNRVRVINYEGWLDLAVEQPTQRLWR